MKSCMGGLIIGVAVGMAVASVYPIPMRGCTIRKIKRKVRRTIQNAEDMF